MGSLCGNLSGGKCVTPGGIADTKPEVVPTMQPGSGTTKEDIEMMRKFAQRVLISGAAEIAIIGVVGGVNLIGEAQADPTPCVNATELCQPQLINRPLQTRLTIICRPAGAKAGTFCRQVPQNAAADRR